MLQNIGNPFLKREKKKLENIICKYLNIHLCIYKSSVHILVSSCYNSYGLWETSRKCWVLETQESTPGIKIGDSPLSTWHVDSRCWHHTLFSPPCCKKLWGVSLFHMFFLGTKFCSPCFWITFFGWPQLTKIQLPKKPRLQKEITLALLGS